MKSRMKQLEDFFFLRSHLLGALRICGTWDGRAKHRTAPGAGPQLCKSLGFTAIPVHVCSGTLAGEALQSQHCDHFPFLPPPLNQLLLLQEL